MDRGIFYTPEECKYSVKIQIAHADHERYIMVHAILNLLQPGTEWTQFRLHNYNYLTLGNKQVYFCVVTSVIQSNIHFCVHTFSIHNTIFLFSINHYNKNIIVKFQASQMLNLLRTEQESSNHVKTQLLKLMN